MAKLNICLTSWLVDRARDRDRGAAVELLESTARNYLRNNQPMPESLREYLAEAFEAIAAGGDPARALGLKPGKSQHDNYERDFAIANDVWDAHQQGAPYSKEPGGAYEIVARKVHLTPGTLKPRVLTASAIEKIYKRWREAIEINVRTNQEEWVAQVVREVRDAHERGAPLSKEPGGAYAIAGAALQMSPSVVEQTYIRGQEEGF